MGAACCSAEHRESLASQFTKIEQETTTTEAVTIQPTQKELEQQQPVPQKKSNDEFLLSYPKIQEELYKKRDSPIPKSDKKNYRLIDQIDDIERSYREYKKINKNKLMKTISSQNQTFEEHKLFEGLCQIIDSNNVRDLRIFIKFHEIDQNDEYQISGIFEETENNLEFMIQGKYDPKGNELIFGIFKNSLQLIIGEYHQAFKYIKGHQFNLMDRDDQETWQETQLHMKQQK
ncbi:UNKNOWN [Stylonychia lemnae]|uniref:Uncharacterized protein n=1 Tax=Stylonychia lemnae TaxID=5949 RepID=A0A077ZW31_STYLE|nr:UNKNOWN [Stylonychia lemnae]|eukprot:CDW74069.1 UNKNOWN [Stylonychia lemnae]